MAAISPAFGSAYWASAINSHHGASHDRGVAAVGRDPARRPEWAQGELGGCELGGGASSICVARSFSGARLVEPPLQGSRDVGGGSVSLGSRPGLLLGPPLRGSTCRGWVEPPIASANDGQRRPKEAEGDQKRQAWPPTVHGFWSQGLRFTNHGSRFTART